MASWLTDRIFRLAEKRRRQSQSWEAIAQEAGWTGSVASLERQFMKRRRERWALRKSMREGPHGIVTSPPIVAEPPAQAVHEHSPSIVGAIVGDPPPERSALAGRRDDKGQTIPSISAAR